MNAFTHLRHSLLSNRSVAYSITLLLLIAAFLVVGVPGEPWTAWAADGEWTDPAGDVSLPNADIIGGSVTVAGDVIDFRVQFQADPYPYTATHLLGWCLDMDQNQATGTACGSGEHRGADKVLGLAGGLGALDTGNFSGPPSLDICSIGSYDPNSRTIRLLIPLSYFDGDSSFRYLVTSGFGGSGGANDWVPNTSSFDTSQGYLTSQAGELLPFEGRPLCQRPPTLEVGPTDLGFVTVQGQGDPAPQLLSIGDGGTGPLNWTASEDVAWLELSATGGKTPAQIQVSANTNGLELGAYTGHITVSSDNARQGTPQTIYVSLVVNPVAPQASRACPARRAGRLVTSGSNMEPEQSPYLQWYEYFGEHSFSASDTIKLSFVIVPFDLGLTIVGLDEIGGQTGYSLNFTDGLINGVMPYTAGAWNTVEADYNFATRHYVLTVNGKSSAPIPIHPSVTPTVQAFRVFSLFAGQVTSAWIDSISVVKLSGSASTLYFGATFDDGRIYEPSPGTIQSAYPPGSLPLPVSCGGIPPVLQISPAELEFTAVEGDARLDAQSFSISNGGGGHLNWTASEGIDWLNLSSSGGTAPSAIQATATSSGLSAGEYSGPITIFGDDAQGSPKIINVHLHVKPSLPIVLAAASGYDNIRLDWNPTNNPYVTSYSVERSTGQSGDFAPIAAVSDTTYLDEDSALQGGTEYCYRVVAQQSDGNPVKESDVDCATAGRLDLWVPDTWAAPGQTAVVPVKIRNAAGLRLAAGDIWLNYDGTAIDLLDISKTPMTADYTWGYAITSTSTYSQARIAAISDPPPMLYGSGSLFWLTSRVTGSEGQTSTVAFQEFIAGLGGTALYAPEDLAHPIPLQIQNGVFHVASGHLLGDLNGDGVIQATDAYLALQVASGEFIPVAEQRLAGDVNGDDRVDAADVSMILYYAAHGVWPQPPTPGAQGMQAQAGGTAQLSLDDVHGAPGADVRTDLRAENLSDWTGAEVLITYDPRLVAGITGVEAGQLASGLALQYHDEGDGLLRIELAGNEPVSGSGVLATIAMQIAPNVSCGKTSPLALADVRLNDMAGRDFATSALQQMIVRESADLYADLCTYLPFVVNRH